MEEDAASLLSFMASNGLIANADKTSLVILNQKKKDKDQNNPLSITIGKAKVTQVEKAKFLGITFNDKQNWSAQIHGIGGVVASLNQRMFIIKRLKNQVGADSMKKLVDGLFRKTIFFLHHWDLNHGPLEPKASVLIPGALPVLEHWQGITD